MKFLINCKTNISIFKAFHIESLFKQLLKIAVVIFVFSYSDNIFSQNNDTLIILKHKTQRHFFVFPFHEYKIKILAPEFSDHIIIKSDSSSIVSKDIDGNYSIIFIKNRFNCASITVCCNNVNNDSTVIKYSYLPVQMYTYFIDDQGEYILSGGTIGTNNLKNKSLFVGTIFSSINKSYKIISFSILYFLNNSLKKIEIIGTTIKQKQWRKIKKLPSGHAIIIKDIQIILFDDYNTIIEPFILYR